MLRDDSKVKLDTVIDDLIPSAIVNSAAADIEPVTDITKVKSLHHILTEYQQFDGLIEALRDRSSYNKITSAEIVWSIITIISSVTFILACNVGVVAAIYYMQKNNRFHPHKKYPHEKVPGTNLTCGEVLPSNQDDYLYDAGDPLLFYCANEYDDLIWLAAAMYSSAIIISCCSFLLSCLAFAQAGVTIENWGKKIHAKIDDLPVRRLKNQYKKEMYETCINHGVLVDPRDLGVSVSNTLSNCLPNRHQFFNLVTLSKDSDSRLSCLPNEISLIIAAYAKLLDKKTRRIVIKNAFIDRLPKAEKSAFYAADESAEDFDIPLTSAAAAASPLLINSVANERTPLRASRR